MYFMPVQNITQPRPVAHLAKKMSEELGIPVGVVREGGVLQFSGADHLPQRQVLNAYATSLNIMA